MLNYCPGGLEKRQKCNCPPSPSNRHGIVRVRISVEVMIVAKITVRPKIIQKSPGVRGFSLGVFCFQRNPLKGGFSAGDFSEGFLRRGWGFSRNVKWYGVLLMSLWPRSITQGFLWGFILWGDFLRRLFSLKKGSTFSESRPRGYFPISREIHSGRYQ